VAAASVGSAAAVIVLATVGGVLVLNAAAQTSIMQLPLTSDCNVAEMIVQANPIDKSCVLFAGGEAPDPSNTKTSST
jgi:hypothetical protein